MTQREYIDLANQVSKILKEKGGYIKGMGTGKYRLMDGEHNPIRNLDQQCINLLLEERLIVRNGLVYSPTFNIGNQIKHPEKSKKK